MGTVPLSAQGGVGGPFYKVQHPSPYLCGCGEAFSRAGNILRANRSTLDEVNFEELVFLKGNMHVLGYQHYEEY